MKKYLKGETTNKIHKGKKNSAMRHDAWCHRYVISGQKKNFFVVENCIDIEVKQILGAMKMTALSDIHGITI